MDYSGTLIPMPQHRRPLFVGYFFRGPYLRIILSVFKQRSWKERFEVRWRRAMHGGRSWDMWIGRKWRTKVGYIVLSNGTRCNLVPGPHPA
eukprot:scaffold19497_cov58-Attheya_sp.AAC.4